MRRALRTTFILASFFAAEKQGFPQASSGETPQQQGGVTAPKATADCNTRQTPAAESTAKVKRTLSWAQRHMASLAAIAAGQCAGSSSSPAGDSGQTTAPAPSEPCPAPAPNTTAGAEPLAAPSGHAVPALAGRSLFSGTANNNQFGRGQSGRGTGSGNSYIEWNHDGRAANSEIPVVFIKEPNKGPAQAGYLGHEKSDPTVHYLRSTAEQKTYRVEFSGTQFTVYLDDETRVEKLKLVGGTQQTQDDSGGAEAGSLIELSEGNGRYAMLTYTDPQGNTSLVAVHRRNASATPDGIWLNHDNSVEYTVSGASVTASPVKQP